MATAKLTWIYRLYPEPAVYHEVDGGLTFEEAIKDICLGEIKPILVRREWRKYAWPGGYPIYYATQDNGCLCAKCANGNIEKTLEDDPQWKIVQSDINWEDPKLYCDNCAEFIESAYGESTEDLQEFIKEDDDAGTPV